MTIAVATIPIRAGDGPLMETLPLLINEVTKPPTIAAITPAKSALLGSPIANAIPIDRGNATNETLNPARTSVLQYCLIERKRVLILFIVADKEGCNLIYKHQLFQ